MGFGGEFGEVLGPQYVCGVGTLIPLVTTCYNDNLSHLVTQDIWGRKPSKSANPWKWSASQIWISSAPRPAKVVALSELWSSRTRCGGLRPKLLQVAVRWKRWRFHQYVELEARNGGWLEWLMLEGSRKCAWTSRVGRWFHQKGQHDVDHGVSGFQMGMDGFCGSADRNKLAPLLHSNQIRHRTGASLQRSSWFLVVLIISPASIHPSSTTLGIPFSWPPSKDLW